MRHGLLQVHSPSNGFACAVVERGDEISGIGDSCADHCRCIQCGTASGNQFTGIERGQVIERLRPLGEIRIPGVAGSIVFHQVAGVEHLLGGHPDQSVALGVAAPELHDTDLESAQPQPHLVLEDECWPGQARNTLHTPEQARKTAYFRVHILLSAFHDQIVGILAGDNLFKALFAISRGTQNAHRVVVSENHIFDWFICHLPHPPDDLLRHYRRGSGIDDHYSVVADNHTGVGIALRSVGPAVIGKLAERDLFLFQIGAGRKLIAHL